PSGSTFGTPHCSVISARYQVYSPRFPGKAKDLRRKRLITLDFVSPKPGPGPGRVQGLQRESILFTGSYKSNTRAFRESHKLAQHKQPQSLNNLSSSAGLGQSSLMTRT